MLVLFYDVYAEKLKILFIAHEQKAEIRKIVSIAHGQKAEKRKILAFAHAQCLPQTKRRPLSMDNGDVSVGSIIKKQVFSCFEEVF